MIYTLHYVPMSATKNVIYFQKSDEINFKEYTQTKELRILDFFLGNL